MEPASTLDLRGNRRRNPARNSFVPSEDSASNEFFSSHVSNPDRGNPQPEPVPYAYGPSPSPREREPLRKGRDQAAEVKPDINPRPKINNLPQIQEEKVVPSPARPSKQQQPTLEEFPVG